MHVRTVTVIDDRGTGRSVVGGLRDLTVLTTTGSQFWGSSAPAVRDRASSVP